MNEDYEKEHMERVRRAILEEKENTVCEYLSVKNRILYCTLLKNDKEVKTAPCQGGCDKDRLVVGVTKHNCTLLKESIDK